MRWSVLFAVAACGGGHSTKPDSAVTGDVAIDMPRDSTLTPDADPNNPPTLYDTGLCVDRACTQINAGISAYTPSFALWSDAATKRRWIQLPAGAQIDTTDPDHWVFPVGTKIWKEFTAENGGPRIETRFIWRQAMGTQSDWFYLSYEWNAPNDDTTAQPFGDMNVNGTQHDIPARFQCKLCHEGISSRVLGFGAIQLDHAAATGDIAIDDLVTGGKLTQNPPGASAPHYPLPGTGSATAAIGYLHANCGHCHNPQSKVFTDQNINMTLRLAVGSLGSLSATPVYQTAVDHDASIAIDGLTKRIVTDDPTHSILIDRFSADPTSSKHMPQLGSEVIDTTAQATLVDWITHIQ
ncbi:MAG: hypothetical protein JO257_09210 [Deltaproteobacteria bacterium]|nr:hypothetical protein [Deltaproteobacteria bacterium]